MNEQLTLQSTQHEETKTVPMRRRKACLAGTFALFAACALVLLIPHPAYAGIIGDFLDIPNMIKTWLLQIAATLFNTYFGVINQTLDAKFISGPFNELFGTTEPYGVVKDFYQAGVIPVAHAILGLFMLMQLIKISQRIDATSTLPAVKDIVFLVVTYCILSYFIDNALDLVSAIYSIFNDLVGNVSDKDWGNGAAIVKNADGSYTYDASERTENKDGTWTVKTDTQTLTEQEDGTWKLTGLEGSGSATADGGTSFVRNIEETYKADEVEVAP